MVPSGTVKILVPNVKRNVPGGGSLLWQVWSRGILLSVGLLSKGFLRLERNIRVDGMDKFLKVLETERSRGIITGTSY